MGFEGIEWMGSEGATALQIAASFTSRKTGFRQPMMRSFMNKATEQINYAYLLLHIGVKKRLRKSWLPDQIRQLSLRSADKQRPVLCWAILLAAYPIGE